MKVVGPVRGFACREVTEMEAFHGIEEDTSAGCSEPRAPGRVLGIVVTTGKEALAKRGVIKVEELRSNSRIRSEVDCRNGKRARWVDHGNRRSLDGG
jgi:hypothetical protein